MNTETLLTVLDFIFATASIVMVAGAIRTTVQDRADCLAREQGTRRLVTGAR